MLTSGEESSAECLDTDEEQRSEEWLVRSKALQMKLPPVPLHPVTPENKTCFCDQITFLLFFVVLRSAGLHLCAFYLCYFLLSHYQNGAKDRNSSCFASEKEAAHDSEPCPSPFCMSKSLNRSPSACTDTCLLSAHLHDCLLPLCLD